MLLLELSALVVLSSLTTSPEYFALLVGTYGLFKIVRSWLLRGCLPGGGGGGFLSGGGGSGSDDLGDRSDHPDFDERRRLAASNSNAGLPVIKLVPLGREASDVIDRVMMAENNGGDGRGAPEASASGGGSNAADQGGAKEEVMQPPKLKKEYRKEKKQGADDAGGDDAMDDSRGEVERELDACMMELDDDDGNDGGEGGGMDVDGPGSGGAEKNAIEQMVEDQFREYSLDCYPYTFSPLLLFTNSGYFDRGYSNYNAVAAFFAPALRGLGGGGDSEETGVGSGRREGTNGGRSSRRNSRAGEGRSNGGDAADESRRDGGDGNDEEEEDYQDLGGINMLHNVVYDRKNLTYDELFNHIASTQSLVTCCIDAHFTAFQMLNKNTLLYYDPLSPSLSVAKGEADVHKAALYLLMKCHYGDNGHVHENKKYYTSPTSTRLQSAV